MLCVLKNDRMVRPDAFNGSLNAENFVDIIFTLFTSMLLKEQYDYKPVLEIVARCIYLHIPAVQAGNFYSQY